MALQRQFEFGGSTYPEAYTRIVYVLATSTQTTICANTYADKATRDREPTDPTVMPLVQESYVVGPLDLDGVIYEASYAHLKTLPEYFGAIDVIENPPELEPSVVIDPQPEASA